MQPTKTVSAPPEALDVIARMEFTEGVPLKAFLPAGQLARPLYESVNKALEALGGKWNKSAKAHLFTDDPRPQLYDLIERGQMTVIKDGFFATPAAVVRQMIALAQLSPAHVVLEPSAGEGDIADLVRPLVESVDVIEFNDRRRSLLGDKGYNVVGSDFLSFAGTYARILMNPPFERGQDVEHVMHAYGCLVKGGVLVAIMSEGTYFRTDKKTLAFRERASSVGENVILPAASFRASGTDVNCRIQVLYK